MIISLIGLPGGGKSTIGRQLARRTEQPFFDSDTVIEKRIGEPIRSFFEHHGEAAFRDIEQDTLAELLQRDGGVLATGGGIVLRPANRTLLKERSLVFYLRSSPEELFRRLRHDTTRPLLQVPNPLAKLRALHAERDAFYRECAHFVIDTGRPSVGIIVGKILHQLDAAQDGAGRRGEPGAAADPEPSAP